MSDAAIATIAGCIVTVVTMVIGFLTLWVKLKYGVDQAKKAVDKAEETAAHVAAKAEVVEKKIDNNTNITSEAKNAAIKASEHAESCDRERAAVLKTLSDHDMRIGTLELKLEALKVNLESLDKNVSSTRHEIRGHLQTISNNIHLLSINARASVLGASEEKS